MGPLSATRSSSDSAMAKAAQVTAVARPHANRAFLMSTQSGAAINGTTT